MAKHHQVLLIVQKSRHSQEGFEALKDIASAPCSQLWQIQSSRYGVRLRMRGAAALETLHTSAVRNHLDWSSEN